MVKNDNVIIIDEFTGRAMEGRRFGEGQHQAIEAKENVSVQPENQTLASVTFQNYFRKIIKRNPNDIVITLYRVQSKKRNSNFIGSLNYRGNILVGYI